MRIKYITFCIKHMYLFLPIKQNIDKSLSVIKLLYSNKIYKYILKVMQQNKT